MHKLNIQYLGVGYSCNSIIESGFYEIGSPTNGPGAGDWLIVMLKSPRTSRGDIEAVQVAYKKSDGTQWSRSSDGSAWTAWAQVGAGSGGGGEAVWDDTDLNTTMGTLIASHGLYRGPSTATYESLAGTLEDFATNLAGLPTTDAQDKLTVIGFMAWSAYANSVLNQLPRYLISQGRDPTAADDNASSFDGYTVNVGTQWINTTTKDYFICVDNTADTAVWKKLTFAA